MKKKFWIPIISLLVIAIGCGLFYGTRVTDQEPVKIYKAVPPEGVSQPKPPPPGETYETGHWHGDVWHAVAHEPTRQSEIDIAVEKDVSVEAKARGEHATLGSVMQELGTDIYSVDINKVPPHLRKQAQYFKDKKEWLEKWKMANAEWMQAGRVLDNLGPRDAEQYIQYVKNLSEDEKLEHTTKLKNALEKYKEASRNIDAINEEEPVDPNEEN